MKTFLKDVRSQPTRQSPELREKLYTQTLRHKMYVVRNLIRILDLDSDDLDANAATYFPDLFKDNSSDTTNHRFKRSGGSPLKSSVATTRSISTSSMINSALFFYHQSVSIAMSHERYAGTTNEFMNNLDLKVDFPPYSRQGLMSPAIKEQFHYVLNSQMSTLNHRLSSIVGDSNALTVHQSGKLGLVILNEPLESHQRW